MTGQSDARPLDDVWAWFGARRRGTRYQPTLGANPGEDLNGCVPKLAHLRAAAYELAGAHVVGVGCSSGYYESQLAQDARERLGHGAAHATLIDTDAVALAEAVAALPVSRAADVRHFLGAAENIAWTQTYDLCVFLSLYHHYDRLGAAARRTGDDVLQAIGAHCQTMVFETGQTNDTVAGSGVWRHRLAMDDWSSPTAWLEAEVPRLTGFSRWHVLGTNPVTQRHLYIFWHRTAVTPPAHFAQRRSLRTSSLPTDRSDGAMLWDATHLVDTARATDAIAVVDAFQRVARPSDFLLVESLSMVRTIARHAPTIAYVSGRSDTAVEHHLASVVYAGCAAVATVDNRALTGRCAARLQALGVSRIDVPRLVED